MTQHIFNEYETFLKRVLLDGRAKSDRTGTGTVSLFGHQMRFDLAKGFPLVTTKFVPINAVIAELLWFLSGSTNNNDLRALGSTIWDEWARENGDLGPIYGKQWRSWYSHTEVIDTGIGQMQNDVTIDQIQETVDLLKNSPDSRRIIVSAWNVADLKDMALMPCHALFQFYTEELSPWERFVYWKAKNPDNDVLSNGIPDERLAEEMDKRGAPRYRLSCQLYQRSADMFLGVPFNIASYSLLTMMMAEQCDMVPGEFIWTGGDCHIYKNHFTQVGTLLNRAPRPAPEMHLINKPNSIFEYTRENFVLVDYNPHPAIKAPVAV